MKIIAEIGINHDGSIGKAKHLIDAASNSGSDAIKFQYRNLGNAYSDTAREIGDEILLEEINRNYLSPKDLCDLTAYAKAHKLEVGISFFDEKDIADFSDKIEIFDFFKIPSVELTNKSLIAALVKLNRHIYISLGAHKEAEIESALNLLPKDGWTPLHCVSNYPVAIQNARLGYLTYLLEKWGRPVGYSSHDDNWEVCLLAMQLGATVIERHITLDRYAEGLDHSSSSTPDEFEKISLFAQNYKMLIAGDGGRIPNQGELLNRQNLGRSYFAKDFIAAGNVLKITDLMYRSPNIGINKITINDFLGKPIQTNLEKGAPITKSVFIKDVRLPKDIVEKAKNIGLALPVRLHDLKGIEEQFPIGAFEFHLSFQEVLSEIDYSVINPSNRYSVHLPDYINSRQLMDPFSKDENQKNLSRKILERTVTFANRLQELTGKKVPVVGSFSAVHVDRAGFFEDHSELLSVFLNQGVEVLLQWLPPIAWYFGGSVKLKIMNEKTDLHFVKQYNLGVCMDICHMILGRNYFNFSSDDIMNELNKNIRHIHIADAAGIDGEGFDIGDGELENLPLIRKSLDYDCMKVIEVWQGHLDNGSGFKKAIVKLVDLYENT